MKKFAFLGAALAAAVVIAAPLIIGPTVQPTSVQTAGTSIAAPVVVLAAAKKTTKCSTKITGKAKTAPGKVSKGGVSGTTTADLKAFAKKFNAIRIANCLKPIPLSHIQYSPCMEKRLFWMAEDPSTDPASAWGHIGSKRSDGKKSVGCDGNLAGGSNNTAKTVAAKWWTSTDHRASLYRPAYKKSLKNVCISFAMTHGGLPNEPDSFTRAAARWVTC